MVHFVLMKDFNIKLVDHIEDITQRLKDYVTPRFLKLRVDKKATLILALCRQASRIADPTKVNIKEVAKEAEISIGSIYQYFNSRKGMMAFALQFIKLYMKDVMEEAKVELQKLPLALALEYYCLGSQLWSREEKDLSYFFYQAAYCGNPFLSEELTKPLAEDFLETIRVILEGAQSRGEIPQFIDLKFYSAYIYRMLLPFCDGSVYPSLQPYFFPEGESDLKKTIALLIDFLQKGK